MTARSSAHRPRPRSVYAPAVPGGMTLVEMLVAMAATLVLLVLDYARQYWQACRKTATLAMSREEKARKAVLKARGTPSHAAAAAAATATLGASSATARFHRQIADPAFGKHWGVLAWWFGRREGRERGLI